MYQQWLQVVGLIFDGAGFALIALEWYRGYREMRNKVTLVARNMERAEKARLQRELKDTIGSVGVGEVGPIYNDDQALAEMAQHVFEIDQVDRFKKTRDCFLQASSRSWSACCSSFSGPGPDAAHS